MRALVLFGLTLASTVAFTADASAFGRRRSAAASSEGCNGGGYVASNYGGCYGGGYASPSYGGCYGGGYASPSYGGCYGSGYSPHSAGGCYGSVYARHGSVAHGGSVWSSAPVAYSVTYPNGSVAASPWVPVAVSGGRETTIRATDGTYYTLGADGTYYAASSNGVMTRSGVTTQTFSGATTVHGGASYSPATYPGTNNGSGVIQVGGTVPLSMPVTTNSLRMKQLLGTRMLIGNNTQVGTVEDLVSDGSGNLGYLIVSTDGNKLVSVPWDAAAFDAEKKTATVNVTQEVWKTVPTFTTTTYPQFFTPTYRTDIYKAYGLTPRESRRIP